jgi:diguanylate cyclase (GGDEF)-like protein
LLANMRRRSLVTLVGVSTVGALVLAAAWFMARWSFLRPLAALVVAAKKLRAGDLKVRVNSRELWAPEFSELAVALNIAAMRLERNHRTLFDRANRDGLTGLASRRRFDEQLNVEWRRARRAQTPLSVLMIDVDEFKTYNDRYGHVMGDECLRQIAAALLRCLRRPSDMAARYGGEEIIILLPDTDLAGAAFMGTRFLNAVHDLGIVHRSRPDGIMSVSIGVASVVPADDEEPIPVLVKTADQALYQAKRGGRARVVVAGSEVLSV